MCGKCFLTSCRNCVAVPLSPVASVLIPVPRQPRQSARPDPALAACQFYERVAHHGQPRTGGEADRREAQPPRPAGWVSRLAFECFGS